MEKSCGGAGGTSPLAKGNSGGVPAVDAWAIWENSWDGGPEVGPTANPLAGDEVAAVAAADGPAERTGNPFVAADGDPPTGIGPGN